MKDVMIVQMFRVVRFVYVRIVATNILINMAVVYAKNLAKSLTICKRELQKDVSSIISYRV